LKRPGAGGLTTDMTTRSSAKKLRYAWLPLAVALVAIALMAGGCGLQTDEANKQLAAATKHQEEAEAILARMKAFPGEWEALFNVSKIGQAQVDGARQLVAAREADLDTLEKALSDWEADLRSISKLNVEQGIKEYIRLKLVANDLWQQYVEDYLRPLIAAYSGMVEIIAYGRPLTEQNAKAQEMTNLVNESAQKLEEAQAAEKRADQYFKENKLGS
jgi:hypothetical protein